MFLRVELLFALRPQSAHLPPRSDPNNPRAAEEDRHELLRRPKTEDVQQPLPVRVFQGTGEADPAEEEGRGGGRLEPEDQLLWVLQRELPHPRQAQPPHQENA